MAHQVHIGRLDITSPASLDFSGGGGERQLRIQGKIAETDLATVKYIRDELVSMAQSGVYVPFRYDGDSTFDGYVYLTDSSVDIARYSMGGFNYSLDMEYLGKVGEVVKESVLTGKLLDNAHSITSTSQQFHSPPGNHYNYFHQSNPTDGTRVAGDLTTTTASDTVTMRIKRDSSLRGNNAQFHVDPADFYKGSVRITTDSKVRNGLASPNVSSGAILENGIVKIRVGSNLTQSRIVSYLWDTTSYGSEVEWAVHRGTPSGSNQLSTEFRGWKTIQILRNTPELGIIRLTSHYQASGQDRLTLDISLRRGAHHASLILNQSPISSRLNISLSEDPSSDADTATGYIKAGAVDGDGNKWLLGSPSAFTEDLVRGLIYPTTGGTQFKAFIGYELYESDLSVFSHNSGNSVRDQYLDNVSEYCKVVKA